MRKLFFPFFAMFFAGLMSSCESTAPINPFSNDINQQDDVHSVTLEGIIKMPFIDREMAPSDIIGQDKRVWCYFDDVDYKLAVRANAAVIADSIVKVEIEPTLNWWHEWKYRIVKIDFFSKDWYYGPCNHSGPNYSPIICDSIWRKQFEDQPKEENPPIKTSPTPRPIRIRKGCRPVEMYTPVKNPVCNTINIWVTDSKNTSIAVDGMISFPPNTIGDQQKNDTSAIPRVDISY